MSDDADSLPSETDSPVTPESIGPRDRPRGAPEEGPLDVSARCHSADDNVRDRQRTIAQDVPEPVESRFGLRPSDQLFVAVLAGVALMLMGVHWLRLSGWGMNPIEIEHETSRTYKYRIDINTAGESELIQLEGVGPILAKRIVADRVRNGPFRTIDDLNRVRGFGPRKVETIRKWLTLGPDDQVRNAPDKFGG